jgi:hypothetical protein
MGPGPGRAITPLSLFQQSFPGVFQQSVLSYFHHSPGCDDRPGPLCHGDAHGYSGRICYPDPVNIWHNHWVLWVIEKNKGDTISAGYKKIRTPCLNTYENKIKSKDHNKDDSHGG